MDDGYCNLQLDAGCKATLVYTRSIPIWPSASSSRLHVWQRLAHVVDLITYRNEGGSGGAYLGRQSLISGMNWVLPRGR